MPDDPQRPTTELMEMIDEVCCDTARAADQKPQLRKEIDRLNKTPTALAEELKTSMQYSDVFHRKPLPEFRPVADLIGKAELQPVPDHYEGAISQKARGDNRPPWKAVLGKNAWKPLPGLFGE